MTIQNGISHILSRIDGYISFMYFELNNAYSFLIQKEYDSNTNIRKSNDAYWLSQDD